jgi:C4-type Zn-finger protein
MESDGTCSECGYGEEEEYEEEGEEEENGHMERMVEIRDDLQRLVDKLSKLIS